VLNAKAEVRQRRKELGDVQERMDQLVDQLYAGEGCGDEGWGVWGVGFGVRGGVCGVRGVGCGARPLKEAHYMWQQHVAVACSNLAVRPCG
jgi:hypothetical protein